MMVADKILMDVVLNKETHDRIKEKTGVSVKNGADLVRTFIRLMDMHDTQIENVRAFREAYEAERQKTSNDDTVIKEQPDDVIHPKHYCQEGSMECIDEMMLIFGEEETKIYCKLAAWKYRKRLLDKDDPVKDMRKSDAYLRCFKAIKEEGVARFE